MVADVYVDPDGDLARPGGGGEAVEEFDVSEVIDEEADSVLTEYAGYG